MTAPAKTAAPAKRAPKTAAKKAPAKKAAPAKPATPVRYAFTATGRGGVVNIRSFPNPDIAWAVDVADPKATRPAAQAGLVYRMFESKEKAEAFAEKKNAAGYDAIVVAVERVA